MSDVRTTDRSGPRGAGSTGDAVASGQAPTLPVVLRLTRRGLIAITRIPAAVVPILVMPVFFLVAFSGSYSAITDLPGFPTDNALNWFLPFAIVQGASFAGIGVAFATARDLESGFYDRLLLAPIRRRALVLGALGTAAVRGTLPLVTVLPIGLVAGARIPGGAPGVVALSVAAIGTSALAALWALGVVYRLQSQRALGLVQIGIFATMFLSIGQVPLEIMEGWLHGAARVNPATNILRLARQGFLGEVTWDVVWPGLLAMALMGAALVAFVARGFRRLQP
jgi:ABC-2 type transport system permease protein